MLNFTKEPEYLFLFLEQKRIALTNCQGYSTNYEKTLY